jgi:hypothetical protein
MVARSGRVSYRGLVAAAIVALLGVGAGCATIGPLQGNDLPRDVQIVGGGFRINWIAPTDGTVYLFEKKSGKIVETESLSEGDSYEFEMDLDEEVTRTFENALGVSMEEAKLVLYFKSAPSDN